MKKLSITLGLTVASAITFADAFCVSSNNPVGSGNWNSASFFTSNMGGYLNPGNTGSGSKNPIESCGFYWKNTSGSNAERNALTDSNCPITGEGTNFLRDDYVTAWNNFELGSPIFKTKIDYRLRPPSTSEAVWFLDWSVQNLTEVPRTINWYFLGDLCSRTSAFGNNNLDSISYEGGLTTFLAGGGAPTVYLASSRPVDEFEVSKQTTGSAPDCRLKMQNGLVADTLANNVVGSGVGNWASAYGYVLEMPPGGIEYGSIAIGLNKVPVFMEGTLDLGVMSPDATYPIPITVEIRNVGSTTPLESGTALVYGANTYVYGTSLPAGTYDVAFKGSHWLRTVVSSVAIPIGGNVTVDATLINGSVDGNNIVNTDDYLILSEHFDELVTQGTLGDLDHSGAITTDDYLILSDNFDTVGAD